MLASLFLGVSANPPHKLSLAVRLGRGIRQRPGRDHRHGIDSSLGQSLIRDNDHGVFANTHFIGI